VHERYRRQTDGRQHIANVNYSERELTFPFAKNDEINLNPTHSFCYGVLPQLTGLSISNPHCYYHYFQRVNRRNCYNS